MPSNLKTYPIKHAFKRVIAVTALDLAFALAAALALSVTAPQVALAYVDPSVMTYTIQALAGVAVALSTVLGVAWRRSRKKLLKMLGIDENARKIVEPDCHRVKDGVVCRNPHEPAHAKTPETQSEPERRKKRDYRIKWHNRIGYTFVLAILVMLTLFVLPPVELLVNNASELTVGLMEAWPSIVFPAAVGAVTLAVVASFIPGKPFHVVISVLFSVAVAAYVQALALNVGLPAADGSQIDFSNHKTIVAASTLMWLAVLIVPLVLMRFNPKAWRRVLGLLAVVVIAAQGIELGVVATEGIRSTPEKPHEYQITEDGLFEVAPSNNIIYLVLDTYDLVYADELLRNEPEYFEPLEDFTYYRNSTGTMIPTRNALPCMVSGRLPQNETEAVEFVEVLYDGDTPLDRLADAGYSVGVYSDAANLDDLTPCRQALANKVMNVHGLEHINIDYQNGALILAKCSLYREAPWLLKPLFQYYTTDIDNNLILQIEGYDPYSTPYTVDDPLYYSKLQNHRLSINEDVTTGAFRFIHLQGPHPPFKMDANAQSVESSTVEEQTRGSMTIANEYLQQLKDLGVYDSSTIIITADHGVVLESVRNIKNTSQPGMATCPVIFYKPPKSDDGARNPMKVSDSPVSALDIAPTFLRDAGLDHAKFGTTLTDDYDPLRSRIFDMLFLEDDYTEHIVQYSIEGYAGDLANWHPTGLIMTRHFN